MKPQQLPAWWFILCSAPILMAGCKSPAQSANTITLATTTSTQESGLLDVLIPKFREQSGIDVRVVAVGSGQALELGRRGDADILLTHAPAAEQKFMDEGWGEQRRPLMHNDFVLLGPRSDPANAAGQTSITETFSRISDREAPFVSRGDESGTHQKEQEFWEKAGREPAGDWYIRAGAGMSQTLRMANEKRAYTLSDRATFLTLRRELELEILTERDPIMRNDYSVVIVNPKKHPHLNDEAARQFADFLTDPATKELIAEFGVAKFGEPLFFPKD